MSYEECKACGADVTNAACVCCCLPCWDKRQSEEAVTLAPGLVVEAMTMVDRGKRFVVRSIVEGYVEYATTTTTPEIDRLTAGTFVMNFKAGDGRRLSPSLYAHPLCFDAAKGRRCTRYSEGAINERNQVVSFLRSIRDHSSADRIKRGEHNHAPTDDERQRDVQPFAYLVTLRGVEAGVQKIEGAHAPVFTTDGGVVFYRKEPLPHANPQVLAAWAAGEWISVRS